MALESPIYQVIEKKDNMELRKYEGFYTSSVYEPSILGDQGFGMLFSYISGENHQGQKMAMTVPVINEWKENQTTMEFVIPKAFYGQGVPKPIRPGVFIRHYEPQVMAVIRFSGSMNSKNIQLYREQLMTWIQSKNLTLLSPMRLARYNSPFSIPLFRRNEILFTVRP